MKTLYSQAYRQLCEEMHKEKPWGTKGYRYIDDFYPHVKRLGCQTLLDYGCGRATIKEHLAEVNPEITVYCYDPCVPEYDLLPDSAHFVVCTDVMEHVEEQYVANVLEHICTLTERGAYFAIALTKAKRDLPDGTNAHITIKSAFWWIEQLKAQPWKVAEMNAGKKSLRVFLKKV